MKVTRKKISDLKGTLEFIKEISKKQMFPVKFLYACTRNMPRVDEVIQPLEEIGENHNEAMIPFHKERDEICRKYCEMENDKPKFNEGHYIIPDTNKVEFELKIEELKEKYKEVLDNGKELQKQIDEMLAEEIEFEFFQIDCEHLPEKGLPYNIVEILSDTIIKQE